MNGHERIDDTGQTEQQSEWDNLGKSVTFGEKPSISAETKKLVETTFSDSKLDDFFDACSFDDGAEDSDRSNPNHYTPSLFLSKFLTLEEQEAIVEARTTDKSIPPDLAQKLKDGLAEIIDKSPVKVDLSIDPFLRNRHIDQIAGRDRGEDLSNDERIFIDIIHKTDQRFYESAGSILPYDADFIQNAYHVDNVVNKIVSANPNQNPEALKKQSIDALSYHIQNLIHEDDISLAEIVKDPFLRKRHFDSLADIGTDREAKINPNLMEIWGFDIDFEDSIDYSMGMLDKVEQNPDIYGNVDEKEINQQTDEILEKIPDKKLAEIARIYEKDPRRGDQALIEFLAPLLGLGFNPPGLTYGASSIEKEKGHYNRFKHLITVCEDNIKKTEEDNSRPILGIFRRKKPDELVYMRMNVVAHETWHAHQWAGQNVDADRRQKYQQNFAYYLRGTASYDDYCSQLIEAEAFAFGEKLKDRTKQIYGEK